jgi:hypothetical protein
MKYLMLITFTDLADERPRVVVKFIEAESEDEATVLADQFAADARKLMDLAVCDWRGDEEWKSLDGELLLNVAGYAFGTVEIWSGEQILHVVETPFGPCDLERCQAPFGPEPPSPPGFPVPPCKRTVGTSRN